MSRFSSPGFKAAPIHKHIFRLDSRIVATPNFDKIYDTLANHLSRSTIAVKSYMDSDIAAAIRGEGFVIIKVHGTTDQPADLIFTQEEYTKARYRYAHFYAVLDALALTHTFLFLGSGLSDPDIRFMLENHAHRYGHSHPHYIVAPKSTLHADVQRSIERNRNVRFLSYHPADHHKELVDSIADLVVQVEARREYLAANRNW